nr:NADH dehydrogenase subunit 2 [Galdieria sp.]
MVSVYIIGMSLVEMIGVIRRKEQRIREVTIYSMLMGGMIEKESEEGMKVYRMIMEEEGSKRGVIGVMIIGGMIIMLGKRRREEEIIIMQMSEGYKMMMIGNEWMVVYMGMEWQSMGMYSIGIGKGRSIKEREAGIKYMIVSGIAGGMYMMGVVRNYKETGSMKIIESEWIGGKKGWIIGSVMMKIGVVPMHMWIREIYEGISKRSMEVYAVWPKWGIGNMLCRWEVEWGRGVWVIVVVGSIIVGSIGGYGEESIRRWIGYSTISQMGYMLMGMSMGNKEESVEYYISVYSVMMMGMMGWWSEKKERRMKELVMESKRNSVKSGVMMIVMYSMMGMPVMSGFWSKYRVMMESVRSGEYGMGIVGVIGGVIGGYYYVKMIEGMYFKEGRKRVRGEREGREGISVMSIMGVGVVYMGIEERNII